MATPKKILTIEEYRAAVQGIVSEELKNFDPDDIRAEVRGRLQSASFELVMAALGLTKKWGTWEVDHCNGLRNAAADVILSDAKTAAADWLKEQAGQLPDLPKAAIAALHRDYKGQLEGNISDMLRERAHEDALRFVEEMMAKDSAH